MPLRLNTPMGWLSYAGMTEADLGAIYDSPKTRPAVDHGVVSFGAPPVAAPAVP